MTLTYEFDLGTGFERNQLELDAYPVKKSFRSNVIVRTQIQIHTTDQRLYLDH